MSAVKKVQAKNGAGVAGKAAKAPGVVKLPAEFAAAFDQIDVNVTALVNKLEGAAYFQKQRNRWTTCVNELSEAKTKIAVIRAILECRKSLSALSPKRSP